MRTVFPKAVQAQLAFDAAPEETRRNLPSYYSTLQPLLKEPLDILMAAIDQSLSAGDTKERTGALWLYSILLDLREVPKDPAYLQRLLHLLAEDDLRDEEYTKSIAGALYDYPSRETVLALMDIAARARSKDVRAFCIFRVGSMVGVDWAISTKTTPLEKEKKLSDFQSWFAANKDRIQFTEDGRPRLAGGAASRDQLELTAEDRGRIRNDPICVLRLAQATLGGADSSDAQEMERLSNNCGVALFGAEGSALLKKDLESMKVGGGSSMDLEVALSSSVGKYPQFDAVLLAIGYVAAYNKDQQHLNLARDMLEVFGSPDIRRVLKGEPAVVRKSMKELEKSLDEADDPKVK